MIHDLTHDMYLADKRAKAIPERTPAPTPTAPAQYTYTSHDARRLTGVSLRSLQWWDEQGIVSPIQQGHKRKYTEEQIEELRRIHALRKAGIGLAGIRRYLKWHYSEVVRISVPTIINGTLVVPKMTC